MLIHDPIVRAQKSKDKHSKILCFLREETWSSRKILTKVLKLSEASAYKTLSTMIDKGWLIKFKPPGLNFDLFGITSAGLMESWEYSELKPVTRATFQPSKIRPLMVTHYLTIQEARLNAECLGWFKWIPGKYVSKDLLKRPDALATSPTGLVVNVEAELTIKSLKNYKIILSKCLQDIKKGHYQEVHYLTRTKRFTRSLHRQYSLIDSINVGGATVSLAEKHKSKIKIFEIENWPQMI